MTLKAYTKGERVLRFEAIVHNTRTLHTGRTLDKFAAIVARLAGMVDRFTTMLDCVDIGFLPDGILDQLPPPSQIGAVRVGGVDTNKPRTRARAGRRHCALAIAPDGFTVADLAAKVRTHTGNRATPSAKPPTTCASSAANNSSSNPAGPTATWSPPTPPAPSPH